MNRMSDKLPYNPIQSDSPGPSGQRSVDLPSFIKNEQPAFAALPQAYDARRNALRQQEPEIQHKLQQKPVLPAFLSGDNTPDIQVSPYAPSRSRLPRNQAVMPAQRPVGPPAYEPLGPLKTRQIPRQKPRPEKIRNQRPIGRQMGAGQSPYGNSFGFDQMTRTEALQKVRGFLRRDPTHPNALRLINLFQLHSEELSEAGVPYETLKGLARIYTL